MPLPAPPSLQFLIEGRPAYLAGYTLYTEALQVMVDQKRALVADDWARLTRLANEGIGQAYGAFTEMARTVGVLDSLATAVNKEFAELLAAQARDEETREAFFAKVKEVMAAAPDMPPAFIEGVDEFRQGKVTGNLLYEALRGGGPEVEDSDKIRDAIDATVALATRSLMGLTFADFQRHHETLLAIEFQPAGEMLGAALEQHVSAFREELDTGIRALYSAAAAGSPPDSVAHALVRKLEDSLPAFGRVQATIRRYATFLRDEGRGTASEAAGRLGALAGDLTRAAFASYAA